MVFFGRVPPLLFEPLLFECVSSPIRVSLVVFLVFFESGRALFLLAGGIIRRRRIAQEWRLR
jgi:hypothetical protein